MFFAFQGYDLGNDTIVLSAEPAVDSSGSVKVVPLPEGPLPHPTFATQTSRGFMDINKETTIGTLSSTTAASPSKSEKSKAQERRMENFVVVDWKKETVTYAGVTKTFKEAHKKPAGAGWTSSDLDWTWGEKRYKVKHKNGTVTVSECVPKTPDEVTNSGSYQAFVGSDQAAVLTLLKRHPFKKDELANVRFTELKMPDDEMAFILFIILFSNLRLPPDEPPLVSKHFYIRIISQIHCALVLRDGKALLQKQAVSS